MMTPIVRCYAVCVAVVMCLLALTMYAPRASATGLQLSFIQFETPYTPKMAGDTSTGARINFPALDASLVATDLSNATIRRGAVRIVVPVASVTPPQGGIPGSIQFSKAGTMFMP